MMRSLPGYLERRAFAGITAWLNTSAADRSRPARSVARWSSSTSGLPAHQLPADAAPVEAWYGRCAKDGSAVVGARTPEFALEHVVPDVRAQAAALGEHYPAATDDNRATWPLTRAGRRKRQADAYDGLAHWTSTPLENNRYRAYRPYGTRGDTDPGGSQPRRAHDPRNRQPLPGRSGRARGFRLHLAAPPSRSDSPDMRATILLAPGRGERADRRLPRECRFAVILNVVRLSDIFSGGSPAPLPGAVDFVPARPAFRSDGAADGEQAHGGSGDGTGGSGRTGAQASAATMARLATRALQGGPPPSPRGPAPLPLSRASG